INTTATINSNFNLTTDQNSADLSAYTITPDQMEVLQERKDHRILTVNEREYEFLYSPLIIREKQVGYYSVALSTSFLFDTSSFNAWSYGIMAVVFSLVIIIVGGSIASKITKPLDELVE